MGINTWKDGIWKEDINAWKGGTWEGGYNSRMGFCPAGNSPDKWGK